MSLKIWTKQVDFDSEYAEGQIRNLEDFQSLKLNSKNPKPLLSSWPKVIIDVVTEFKPKDSFFSGAFLIVTKCLADLIADFAKENEIEFLPVDVYFENSKLTEYGILRVLTVCDALDRNNSIYIEEYGHVTEIEKISLDSLKASDKAIFMLDTYEWVLCVTSELADLIILNGFKGMAFKTPEEWTPY